jgi:PAS domain S-box-containing protein
MPAKELIRGSPRSSFSTTSRALLRYGIAAGAVLAALAARLAFKPILGEHSPYVPFAAAVLVAAAFGGRRPGLAATALSGVSVALFLMGPHGSFTTAAAEGWWGLLLFVALGTFMSLLAGRLRESEQALRQQSRLTELSHDAIITMDSGRRILKWNAGAQEMYGWTEREAVGKVIHTLLLTSGGPSTAEIGETLRREGQWNGELWHINRDGRRLVVESRQVLIRDEENLAACILEVDRDITSRKLAEDALGESEARYRALVSASSEVLYRMSPDWSEMSHLTGGGFIADTEIPDRDWLQKYIHPDDQPRVTKVIGEAIRAKSVFQLEHRVLRVDGSLGWTSSRAVPLLDANGQIIEWFGAASDITQRKQAEEAMRQALDQRKLALEAANLGAWDYNLDTGEVFWDERSQTIFGATKEYRLSYGDAIARIHPDDREGTDEAFKQAIAGANGGVYNQEFRVVWPDGSVHWVAGHGRVFFQNDGEQSRAVRFAGLNMEITDRKKAEERLRQTAKLESVGLLAGGVAHDFNNLLTVIMGSASSALDQDPSSEHAKTIISAAERAALLTRQLLAYAGKGPFIKKAVDLTDVVSRSKHLLGASIPKRVDLVFNLASDLPTVEEDPGRVEQILMNLVINAGEAIPPKTDARIEVGTGSHEITPEMARQYSRSEVAPGRYVWLEVRDNGVGMDETTLSRIFDPFFSTKFTGRGLQLTASFDPARDSSMFAVCWARAPHSEYSCLRPKRSAI